MENNPIFSLTRRDYETSRQEGLAKIPIISNGDWTDLNASDPGIIVLDYVHALVDMVQFYQDHNALEVYLSTAKERKNLFRLARQLSYKIKSASGAYVTVKFYLDKALENPVFIPAGTSVKTSGDNQINYTTLYDTYLYSGMTETTVEAIQGEWRLLKYKGTGASSLDATQNPADQRIELPEKNIQINTIKIVDDSNRIWEPTDYLVFSSPTDRVFEARLNYDDTTTILFGNGNRGMIPLDTDTLTITYLVTSGSKGRVGANKITVCDESFIDSEGNQVKLKVTNDTNSSGGSDSQSDEDIVAFAPASIKAQGRAVTRGDYEALAREVEGVKDAHAMDINSDPDICGFNEVKVLIIPDDGDELSGTLYDKIYDYISKRMVPPTQLKIMTSIPKYIDINATVVYDKSYTEEAVQYNILVALDNYFLSRSTQLGGTVSTGQLISIISNADGVRYVDKLTSPSETITLGTTEVAKLGECNITLGRSE